jgi:hypothetical protein
MHFGENRLWISAAEMNNKYGFRKLIARTIQLIAYDDITQMLLILQS